MFTHGFAGVQSVPWSMIIFREKNELCPLPERQSPRVTRLECRQISGQYRSVPSFMSKLGAENGVRNHCALGEHYSPEGRF